MRVCERRTLSFHLKIYERVTFSVKMVGKKIKELEIGGPPRIEPCKTLPPLKPWPNGPASSRKWTQVELL